MLTGTIIGTITIITTIVPTSPAVGEPQGRQALRNPVDPV